MQLKKRQLPFDILDSIRGLAALYVTIAHCRGSLWIGGSEFSRMFPRENWNIGDYLIFGSSMLTRLAVEFVIVFFLLSGFSIAHSLSGNRDPLPFYKRRFIRIYPPYIMALVWAGVVFLLTRALFPQWYDGSMTQFSFIRTVQMNDYFEPGRMLRNLFYMPGEGFITPFWSLTYEVIFYLLAPFLLRRISLYLFISAVLFTGGLLFPDVIYSLGLNRYIHDFLFTYNIYFVAGVALYVNFDKVQNFFGRLHRYAHMAACVLVLMVVYAINLYTQTESSWSFMAAAIFSVLIISYFLLYQVRIKPLMSVGKYSYTLYITHLATIFLYLAGYLLIVKPDKPYILNYFVWMPAVLFCLLIAYVQYLMVEGRSKAILNRLRKKQLPAQS